MSIKIPRVSLIIPVYNEERYVYACLEAIARQSVKPFEVIVVNNGSTDQTTRIVRQFPFVTLLHESRHGVVFARNTGFDAAKGDIIGRIDADTVLPSNWIERVQAIFTDETIQATSGSLHCYDVWAGRLVDKIDLQYRKWFAWHATDKTFLIGSNMAVRKSAWQQVRQQLCVHKGLHEDLDLAIHLGQFRGRITFSPELLAAVSARRVNTAFIDYCRYAHAAPYTYAQHSGYSRFQYLYMVLLFSAIAAYIPLYILHRLAKQNGQQLNVSRTTRIKDGRINPTLLYGNNLTD